MAAFHVDTTVKIPNADRAAFEKAAEAAKTGCPISRPPNAKITNGREARLSEAMRSFVSSGQCGPARR